MIDDLVHILCELASCRTSKAHAAHLYGVAEGLLWAAGRFSEVEAVRRLALDAADEAANTLRQLEHALDGLLQAIMSNRQDSMLDAVQRMCELLGRRLNITPSKEVCHEVCS